MFIQCLIAVPVVMNCTKMKLGAVTKGHDGPWKVEARYR